MTQDKFQKNSIFRDENEDENRRVGNDTQMHVSSRNSQQIKGLHSENTSKSSEGKVSQQQKSKPQESQEYAIGDSSIASIPLNQNTSRPLKCNQMGFHISSQSGKEFDQLKLQSVLECRFLSVTSHASLSHQFSRIRILFPKRRNEYLPNQGKEFVFVPTTDRDGNLTVWKMDRNLSTVMNMKIQDLEVFQHQYKILIQFYSKTVTKGQDEKNSEHDKSLDNSLLKTYHVSLHELFMSRSIIFRFGEGIHLNIHYTIKEMANIAIHIKMLQMIWSTSRNSPWKSYIVYHVGKSGNANKHSNLPIGNNEDCDMRVYETDIVDGTLTTCWSNIRTLNLFTSIEDLLSLSFYVNVMRIVDKGKYLNEGIAEISFNNPTIFEKSFLFESKLKNVSQPAPNTLSGILSFTNLPRFLQYIGSSLVINCRNDERSFNPKGNFSISNANLLPCPKINILKSKHISASEKGKVAGRISDNAPTLIVENQHLVKIHDDKRTIEYASSSEEDCLVRAEKPISEIRGMYFEAKILKTGFDKNFVIGFADKDSLTLLDVGSHTYTLMSDGNICSDGISTSYSREIDAGDIVGCGIYNQAVYFTLNGEFLGFTFNPVSSLDLIPFALLTCKYTKLRFNFGQERFVFNFMKIVPNGWKIQEDKQGRLYFKHLTRNEMTYHNPRDKSPEWAKYLSMNDNLVLQLGSSRNKSNGRITSQEILHAMRVIPRAAFVEPELIHKAGSGLTLPMAAPANGNYHMPAALIAYALQELKVERNDKFLTIGTNCGWIIALSAYLVGNASQAIGLVDMDYHVPIIKECIRMVSKFRGITLGAAQVYRRTIFGLSSFDIPVNIARHYDVIFCCNDLTLDQLNDLSLIAKENARLICFQGSILTLFHLRRRNWHRTRQLLEYDSKFITRAYMPSQEEILTEKRLRLYEFLKHNEYPISSIERMVEQLNSS